MRLFDPESRPKGIRPKQPRARNAWFPPGECLRLIYDELREATQALTTRELAELSALIETDPLSLMEVDPADARELEIGLAARGERSAVLWSRGGLPDRSGSSWLHQFLCSAEGLFLRPGLRFS